MLHSQKIELPNVNPKMTWPENESHENISYGYENKSYKKSEELLRKKYYEDIIHNRLKSDNKSIITRCKYRNTFDEPHCSSTHTTCSRYLNTFKCPAQNVISSKETELNIKSMTEMKVTFKESFDKEFCDDLHKTANENNCSDKSTYCRPVINNYNEQFLFKTMEKNVRLKKLVKELMIARRREKDTENWNNFINDLKRKHGNDTHIKRGDSLQYVPEGFVTPGVIEDYYNTKFTWEQSSPCQNLLQDLYKAHDNYYIRQPHEGYILNEYDPTPTQKYSPFETNPICYPTSSQGRFIMLERERQKRSAKRGHGPVNDTINEENKHNSRISNQRHNLKTINDRRAGSVNNGFIFNSRGTNTMLETSSTQTKFHLTLTNEDGSLIKEFNQKQAVSEELNKVKSPQENAQSTGDVMKQNSLACIEDKLDKLIHSINNFMVELKTKRYPRFHKHFDLPTKLSKGNVNITKSDCYGMAKKEKIICGLGDSSSQSTRYSSKISFDRIKHMNENLTKLNKIFIKEIGRNKLITLKDSSVGETYHPCPVQISVTIPTKETSTEVTRSLSKREHSGNNNTVIEEINPPKTEDRRIAIAVNTDPLSLLALLRVSTEETLRRLLSYVPSIDYYYYLSRLQGPPPRAVESHYVCNICGAAFMKPSQLSDHIQKHELGKTRDCCVCRHVLDMPRRRPGLFKCRYCGQPFTRAYCCELHQRSCARRLGIPHDVASNLMLLR